jgi:hypothetical protein
MAALSGFRASYLYVAAIVLFVRPVSAAQFAGGTGEPNDPYQVATAEQLISIGSDRELLDKHFVLVVDIDLDPNLPGSRVFAQAVVAPARNRPGDFISSDAFEGTAFVGDFNGSGYRIKRLTIHGGAGSFLGLFGCVGGSGCVRNLRLEDVDVAGLSCVGGLVGCNRGTIEFCHVSGKVFGYRTVGGLAGANLGNDISWRGSRVVGYAQGRIVNCSASGEVLGGEGATVVGGLVGQNGFLRCCEMPCTEGTIVGCCAMSDVAAGVGAEGLGGLAGWHALGRITDCYASGNIAAGDNSQRIGGLVGYHGGGVVRCYSIGHVSAGEEMLDLGGLLGDSFGSPVDSFWDMEASGVGTSDGGVGLTTTQMMDARTYGLNGWAGDPNWTLDDGKDYPRLVWEEKGGGTIPEPDLEWLSGSGTSDDPYLIATADQLALIGAASILWDKSFLLVSDLDLTGVQVPPIGVLYGVGFSGTFDGNDHVIRHLTLGSPDTYAFGFGLFAFLSSGARVCRLGLEDVNITCGDDSSYVGACAGRNWGTISSCYAQGSISVSNILGPVGGLVGENGGDLIQCHSGIDVAVSSPPASQPPLRSPRALTEDKDVGGLAGENWGRITDCDATGSVSCEGDCRHVGSLVGYNHPEGIIE